jgi:hypothetical protein
MGSDKSTGAGGSDDTTAPEPAGAPAAPAAPGRERKPPRDRRHGAGMLIRPHAGAETRVKSGHRADAPSLPADPDTSEDDKKG